MQMVIRNLGIARGGVTVLSGVAFALPEGRALVLKGPNGIGKTTLLRTIAGLQPAVAGDISMPPESLAYAAHADGLKSMLTVRENLEFWAAIHGVKEVMPALAAMDLLALKDRVAAELSAGQKRRLGLARLLVTGRSVWLLDEPTVSLDTASVALFVAMIRAHLAVQGSALIATHTDLGLSEAEDLDLTPFRARSVALNDGFDEAFL